MHACTSRRLWDRRSAKSTSTRSTTTAACTAPTRRGSKRFNPALGIVSSGTGNTFGHPTPECIERLHNAGIRLFWTETGMASCPRTASTQWAARSRRRGAVQRVDEYGADDRGPSDDHDLHHVVDGRRRRTDPPAASTFVWSKNSNLYHFATCKTAATIGAANLQTGNTPPAGKTLHHDCPK